MLHKSIQILKSKRYRIYTEPYKLNIVGYRSRFLGSNRFDDEIHVFYTNENAKWVYHMFKATTDPGQYWLEHPMNPQGTAFLKKGQYIDGYSLGLHRGTYQAMVERNPVNVIRNYERKGLFKWIETGQESTGNFGINIHRARQEGTTKVIDHFSAGCLVFANASDFNRFLRLANIHKERHGNRFTLTLVDFRDERRRRFQKIAWASALGLGTMGVINYIK